MDIGIAGFAATMIAYAVAIGLWSGRLHMKVTAHEERLRAAENRIDTTTDTLARILSELTRLTTLIEERTSKRN